MDVTFLAKHLGFENLILLVVLGPLQHEDSAVRKPESLCTLQRTAVPSLAQAANSAAICSPTKQTPASLA